MTLRTTRDVLVRIVDDAELLPYESTDDRPFACGHFAAHGHGHAALVGGLYLVVADTVPTQVLPTPMQPWLAFAAFDHLSATPPAASNPDVAAVLARRMQCMELLARLAMTHTHDWQAQLAFDRHARTIPAPFRWTSMLRELVGSSWTEPTTQLALMALRWGHPRFLIEWQHDPIPDDLPVMLEQLLAGVADDNERLWHNDPELAALLEEDRLATDGDKLRAAHRHRVVELGLAFQHGRVTTSLLFGIIEVLERFGDAQRARRAHAIARGDAVSLEFRFTTLRFEHMCSIGGSALEHLGDLVRTSKSLYLNAIKLPRLAREEDRCVQRCLADLTTPASIDRTMVSRPARLRRLACHSDSKSFAVFGSALRYDTALRELDVYYAAHDTASLAAWLAFGLLHVDASSHVASLCVRMPGSQHFDEPTPPHAACTSEWIEIVRRVLSQPVSSHDLAPLDAKTRKSGKRKRGHETEREMTESESPLDDVPLPTDARVLVEVKKNTKARAQPLLRSPVVAVLDAPSRRRDDQDIGDDKDDDSDDDTGHARVTRYQVVRKLRAWLAVAVPGVGAAWIPSSAVARESTDATRVPGASARAVANQRLTSFTWVGGSLLEDFDVRRAHGDALVALLALIGEPLEVLQLPCNGLQNTHFASIVRYCPNLKELNLANNDITDIAPLVQAYATGACKITTLNVAQDGEDHARVVQQTSRILALATERPATCTAIERLALRVTPFDETRIDFYLADVIPAMQTALFQAAKLEFARIHCDDLDQGNLANEITRLRHHEVLANHVAATAGEATTTTTTTTTAGTTIATLPTPIVTLPIPIPSDDQSVSRPLPLRAKLALLSVARHETTQCSALGALDTGVLGLMMQFARTTQMRVVSIAADPPLF